MSENLVLASASTIRADLLRKAGVAFEVLVPRVDEQMIRASLAAEGVSPRDVADALADAKAARISAKVPEAVVLGCDQIMEFGNRLVGKSETLQQARALLAEMNGKAHRLHSATVIYHGGQPQWRHISCVDLQMRVLSETYQDEYLARNWDEIRHCVGGYMLEAEGARLFSEIRGDYFSVLGLPLLEVLAYLGQRGVIQT